MASLTILLIENFGWRADYDIQGLSGILVGVLCVALIQDPERGYYEKKAEAKLLAKAKKEAPILSNEDLEVDQMNNSLQADSVIDSDPNDQSQSQNIQKVETQDVSFL